MAVDPSEVAAPPGVGDPVARKGSLTTAHLVVAALVVLVVNAQLSWWIIFFLRENRSALELKRQSLQMGCRLAAAEIKDRLADAHQSLDLFLASEPAPSQLPPEPMISWQLSESRSGCGKSLLVEGVLVLSSPYGEHCAQAQVSEQWTKDLRNLDGRIEIRPDQGALASSIPSVRCPSPFEHEIIAPRIAQWDEILRIYRSRIVMMVSEGSFFALMLLVLVALLWRTLRREVALEQQHRNFLSAVTHELKSPLAAMRLSLETVLRGRADSGASVRFLENALQDAERLQDLVEKVLEVTRFTRTGGVLVRQETCLSDIVAEALRRFSRRTTAAGANLQGDISPEIWAEVDEEAFSIVISNLLENALKYGGTIPRIDLSLHLVEGQAILEVADNGRGIRSDDVPLVFDRFWRAGDEMTRTTQGTGLGLYLVRRIVEAHRGRVEVHSTGPTGTIFRVMIPHARLAEES